jgi:hypothetical protein
VPLQFPLEPLQAIASGILDGDTVSSAERIRAWRARDPPAGVAAARLLRSAAPDLFNVYGAALSPAAVTEPRARAGGSRSGGLRGWWMLFFLISAVMRLASQCAPEHRPVVRGADPVFDGGSSMRAGAWAPDAGRSAKALCDRARSDGLPPSACPDITRLERFLEQGRCQEARAVMLDLRAAGGGTPSYTLDLLQQQLSRHCLTGERP